ncbi:hypothetical protein NITGR_330039 [Nitrospina gracilis 3/211]|uniref:Uncharacterized protein n=1 Tax=Nitrospina gracilis (strain 3/211) TaxID=1266370 RepID=M1YYU3_NITG3|nr:hypothetical protein NITGR_330039 [Nitrospina gracilis 3/211]
MSNINFIQILRIVNIYLNKNNKFV